MSGSTEPPAATARQLNGWKEIATYLGKSVRSVQRWEVTLGLPVRRIRTPDGVIVYADPVEIDTWKRTLDAPRALVEEQNGGGDEPCEAEPSPGASDTHEPRRPYSWILLAVVAIAASGFGYAAGRVSGDHATVAVEVRHVGRTIEAIGRNGAVVWSYTFDFDVVAPRNLPTLFLDLEGDGESEILVPIQSAAHGTQPGLSDAVYCFSRSGELKWTFAPDYALTFEGERFTAPWEIMDIAVSSGGSPRRIWVAYAHHTWWPGFVVEIAAGQPRIVFAQAGRIFTVSQWTTAAGGMLAIGGAVNALRSATLVLIPDAGATASYPMQGSKPPCDVCPVGEPRRVFLFDTPELTRANHEGFPYINAVRPVGPTLKAQINEGGGASVLMLNNDFSIDSLQFSDRYWAAHRAFETKGRIGHAAEVCPDRDRPREVREWTADGGWRTQRITPGTAGAGTLNP